MQNQRRSKADYQCATVFALKSVGKPPVRFKTLQFLRLSKNGTHVQPSTFKFFTKAV